MATSEPEFSAGDRAIFVSRQRSCVDAVALQERRDFDGDVWDMRQRPRMVGTRNHHVLGVRQPAKDELTNLREPWPARGSAKVENRLRDTSPVLAAETPIQQRR
jgi:hypothetical protein